MLPKIVFIFQVFFYVTSLFAQEADSSVFQIINSVNIDTLKYNVEILSGEQSFSVNNETHLILTRHAALGGNELALLYIKNYLKKYNLLPIQNGFGSVVKNVYAIQRGSKYPDKLFILSAHYDCVGAMSLNQDSSKIAPGADDNASGVAAVLEAARIFSKHKSEYSIMYAFFDAEEHGWVGSRYFVDTFSEEATDILGVINLDMIGWDNNNDGLVEIHDIDTLHSIDLSHEMKQSNELYDIGLNTKIYKPGTNRSDHYSFWEKGLNAILLIEGLYSGDFNPYYHSKNDKIDKFNLNYYSKCTKLAIATVADLIKTEEKVIETPVDFVLYPNYPNPFYYETRIRYYLPSSSFITLKIFDIIGREIETLVNQNQTNGEHEVLFNGNNLSSGIYFYQLYSSGKTITNKMIFLK